ncbi:MAG TPA: hypothetical protein VD862_02815 [Candidatus Paceibacterota bacterium]|nr:hypothetical protein [Candidatus Paceibacterota bacterium]
MTPWILAGIMFLGAGLFIYVMFRAARSGPELPRPKVGAYVRALQDTLVMSGEFAPSVQQYDPVVEGLVVRTHGATITVLSPDMRGEELTCLAAGAVTIPDGSLEPGLLVWVEMGRASMKLVGGYEAFRNNRPLMNLKEYIQ